MANQINSEQIVKRVGWHWRRWILGSLIATVILISILIFCWPSDKITITDRIQAVSAFLIMILTAVLAWITRQYASDTKRMADVMSREFEARMGPMIHFEVARTRSYRGWTPTKREFFIKNVGHFPVTIERIYITFWPQEYEKAKHTEECCRDVLSLGPGQKHPTPIPVELSLDKIPEKYRKGNSPKGNVVFKLHAEVQNVFGEKKPVSSQVFRF